MSTSSKAKCRHKKIKVQYTQYTVKWGEWFERSEVGLVFVATGCSHQKLNTCFKSNELSKRGYERAGFNSHFCICQVI